MAMQARPVRAEMRFADDSLEAALTLAIINLLAAAIIQII
jgi:hypothetical protein